MSTEQPGRHESSHVDQATIEVSQADLYISPGARRAAHRLAWAVVVLSVFFIGLTAATLIFSVNQADINNCQRIVNSRFQQADIDRATASRESAQTQADLWQSLFRLHGTQAQRLAEFTRSFNAYRAKLDRVTAIRYPPKTGTQACAGGLAENYPGLPQ